MHTFSGLNRVRFWVCVCMCSGELLDFKETCYVWLWGLCMYVFWSNLLNYCEDLSESRKKVIRQLVSP